jgi:lambda family phage portal protein
MGILKYISPKWAYKREAWRQAHEIQRRSYDAGTYERLNRNWHASNQSAEATDKNYRDIVRARSRDLERNSDIMNANILPWIRNVVGKGFTLEAQTADAALNEEIEKLWEKWSKKDNCDVTGTQSISEMARMAVRRKKVDGGAMFIKCHTSGGIIPFKLQAIEVDELDTAQFAPRTAGNRVVGGVEYNSYNKAVGYWIREYDIEGYTSMSARYVPAENVIFMFSKTRPSQIREMPEMAATISRIKETNGYIEAASVKERIAACLSVFIKKALPSGGLGVSAQSGKKKDYNEIELTPGLVTDLNAGDDLQVVNPGASATDGSSFVKLMSRLISAGQGVSYEAASRDLSEANYSSARQAMIEDEEVFEPEQVKLLDEFYDEIYKEFLTSAILAGVLKVGSDYWSDPDKYTAHEWNKKPKKWIDPYKEANANKVSLDSGQKTLADIWSEQGKDYKTVLDEMKKIQAYAAEIGLKTSLPYMGGGEEINGGQKEI